VPLLASPALADEYDEDQAGHPLRIAAYVLHPIGWFLDYFIFSPLHRVVGNSPPGRVIFGHRDDFRELPGSPAEKVEAAEAPAAPMPDDDDLIDEFEASADDEI